MRNDFNKDEIVSLKGKKYPVVGGRLRLAHEDSEGDLSITTNIIQYDHMNLAVVSCTVLSKARAYTGLGAASKEKDARLKTSLLELAETRSIARALRFAGYGVEYTGHDELPTFEVPDTLPTDVPELTLRQKHIIEMCEANNWNALTVVNKILSANHGSITGLSDPDADICIAKIKEKIK